MTLTVELRRPVEELPEALKPLRERILSNLTMLARLPAPTGKEQDRVQFLLDRFLEAGLTDATTDEIGNAVGRIRGRRGNRTILAAAHLDDIVRPTQEHEVVVRADRVIGPGVSDNAMGAAVIAMLPAILEHLNIELNSNLVLVGSILSLGRGNHRGIRAFLDQYPDDIHFGVCVEGIELGRLDFFSIAMARADLVCQVRNGGNPSRGYRAESALVVLNQIINRILGIPTPVRPYTVIRMGKLRAGVSYDTEPTRALLGLEIVSHDDEQVDRIIREIEAICFETSARHAAEAKLDVFFRTRAGGIPFGHRLVSSTIDVMRSLGIEPDQRHTPSEVSEMIARDIPAITLGITHGRKHERPKPDYVLIEPILRGVAQVVGVLLAIDAGACDGI